MAQKKSYDYVFKVLLIGDKVGKTSIMMRFTNGTFNQSYTETVGIDFKIKAIDIDTASGTKRVKLQIWDTPHQERFRTMTSPYYRGVHGIMIVFDLTDEKTFDNAINKWMKSIDDCASAGVIRMIVGNKYDDLASHAIGSERGQLIADDMGALYSEVSAKAGYNIDKAFIDIAHAIYKSLN